MYPYSYYYHRYYNHCTTATATVVMATMIQLLPVDMTIGSYITDLRPFLLTC